MIILKSLIFHSSLQIVPHSLCAVSASPTASSELSPMRQIRPNASGFASTKIDFSAEDTPSGFNAKIYLSKNFNKSIY
jgi:hypothetical protein